MKLNILTINICDVHLPVSRGILYYDRKKRINALCRYFEQITDYDIICIQELFTFQTLKQLSKVLIDYNAYYSNYLGHIKGGLVIFLNKKFKANNYRYTVFKNNHLIFHTIPDVIIQKGIQTLFFDQFQLLNTHLIESYNKPKVLSCQLKQLIQLESSIDKNLLTIVTGDFNVNKNTQKKYLSQLKCVLDGIQNCTICDDNPNRKYIKKIKSLHEQYDNIYFDKKFKLNGSKVVLNHIIDGVVVSDHYGVKCQLQY